MANRRLESSTFGLVDIRSTNQSRFAFCWIPNTFSKVQGTVPTALELHIQVIFITNKCGWRSLFGHSLSVAAAYSGQLEEILLNPPQYIWNDDGQDFRLHIIQIFKDLERVSKRNIIGISHDCRQCWEEIYYSVLWVELFANTLPTKPYVTGSNQLPCNSHMRS